MSEEVWVAIITGSASAALVSAVLQPVIDYLKSRTEIKKIKDERNYQEEMNWKKKKEDAYLQAIEYLIRIRRGFDVSHNEVELRPRLYTKEINEINQLGLGLSSKIRLYSSDDIFSRYYELSKFSRYAYSNYRLFEESKEIFTLYCNALARLMSDDLGIKTIPQIAKIKCPQCGKNHEVDDPQCSGCGLGMEQAMKMLYEELNNGNVDLDNRS